MDKIVDVAEDIESTLVATEGEAIGRKYSKNKILMEVIDRRCCYANNMKKVLTT